MGQSEQESRKPIGGVRVADLTPWSYKAVLSDNSDNSDILHIRAMLYLLDVSLPARLVCSLLHAPPCASSGAHLATQETMSGTAARGSDGVLPP